MSAPARSIRPRSSAVCDILVIGCRDERATDDIGLQCVQRGLVFKVIGVQPHLDAVQKIGDHLGVAADGNALIQRVEIVVVKGQPHRQALDDKSRQVLAVAAPLLSGEPLMSFS